MRAMQRLSAAILLGAVFLATPGHAYYARNGFVIVPVPPVQMEVLPRGGLNPIDAWCAAGDYVITMLGMPPDTPIWRVSEPPRPRGASIVFSLAAEGAASSSGLYQIGSQHLYLTAAAGRAFCPASILYWSGL